jgi:hypothetical protein
LTNCPVSKQKTLLGTAGPNNERTHGAIKPAFKRSRLKLGLATNFEQLNDEMPFVNRAALF